MNTVLKNPAACLFSSLGAGIRLRLRHCALAIVN